MMQRLVTVKPSVIGLRMNEGGRLANVPDILERFLLDVNRNSHRGFQVAQIRFQCSVGSGGGMRWRRATRKTCASVRL